MFHFIDLLLFALHSENFDNNEKAGNVKCKHKFVCVLSIALHARVNLCQWYDEGCLSQHGLQLIKGS